MQLHKDSPKMEILVERDPFKLVTLGELVPDWWGTERMAGSAR